MKLNINKKTTVVVLVIILLLISTSLLIYTKTSNNTTNNESNTTQIPISEEEVNLVQEELDKSLTDVIELTIALSPEGVPTSISSQRQYESKPDAQELGPKDYILYIGSQAEDEQGYVTNLTSPGLILGEEFHEDGTISMNEVTPSDSLIVRIPWFPNDTPIQIKDNQGKVILEDTIKATEAE